MIWRNGDDTQLVWGPVVLLVALVLLSGWIYVCTPIERRPSRREVLGALRFGVVGAGWPIVPILAVALLMDYL